MPIGSGAIACVAGAFKPANLQLHTLTLTLPVLDSLRPGAIMPLSPTLFEAQELLLQLCPKLRAVQLFPFFLKRANGYFLGFCCLEKVTPSGSIVQWERNPEGRTFTTI